MRGRRRIERINVGLFGRSAPPIGIGSGPTSTNYRQWTRAAEPGILKGIPHDQQPGFGHIVAKSIGRHKGPTSGEGAGNDIDHITSNGRQLNARGNEGALFCFGTTKDEMPMLEDIIGSFSDFQETHVNSILLIPSIASKDIYQAQTLSGERYEHELAVLRNMFSQAETIFPWLIRPYLIEQYNAKDMEGQIKGCMLGMSYLPGFDYILAKIATLPDPIIEINMRYLIRSINQFAPSMMRFLGAGFDEIGARLGKRTIDEYSELRTSFFRDDGFDPISFNIRNSILGILQLGKKHGVKIILKFPNSDAIISYALMAREYGAHAITIGNTFRNHIPPYAAEREGLDLPMEKHAQVSGKDLLSDHLAKLSHLGNLGLEGTLDIISSGGAGYLFVPTDGMSRKDLWQRRSLAEEHTAYQVLMRILYGATAVQLVTATMYSPFISFKRVNQHLLDKLETLGDSIWMDFPNNEIGQRLVDNGYIPGQRSRLELKHLIGILRNSDQDQGLPLARAVIDDGKCVGCGTCYQETGCDHIIMSSGKPQYSIDDSCYGCGRCESFCRSGAIYRLEEPSETSYFVKTLSRLDPLFRLNRSSNQAFLQGAS